MQSPIAPDVAVSIEIEQSTLYNQDLAPVPKARRTWRVGSYAALWISMSVRRTTSRISRPAGSLSGSAD